MGTRKSKDILKNFMDLILQITMAVADLTIVQLLTRLVLTSQLWFSYAQFYNDDEFPIMIPAVMNFDLYCSSSLDFEL